LIHEATGKGCFLVWGEVWRRLHEPLDSAAAIPPHPFAMTRKELVSVLGTQGTFPIGAPEWASLTLAIPTQDGRPQLSTDKGETPSPKNHSDPHAAAATPEVLLSPWSVEGVCLSAIAAFEWLTSLPLTSLTAEDSPLGDDVRFWSHLSRWLLDLLARGRFLPQLVTTPRGVGTARWQVLLDSAIDQDRWGQFARQMPLLCRLYGDWEGEPPSGPALPRPQLAKLLIRDFCSQVMDAKIRQIALTDSIARQPEVKTTAQTTSGLQEWWQALTQADDQVNAQTVEAIGTGIQSWLAPLQTAIEQFRICLQLIPPPTGKDQWRLQYGLQAIDEPEVVVPASLIWQSPVEQLSYQGRLIERPQETLLTGLGIASRLYLDLEASLQTACPEGWHLNPTQVYQFLREMVDRLRGGGVEVILPTSLAQRSGWANRLGLQIRASLPKGKAGKTLGLQSLLNFEWVLAIGGHTLSKSEFDRLVALKTPLVEIEGEWVELRPQDIRAAQNFFEARKDQTNLSLEDALRLSTGDTQTIEKLPVVSFEASGALQELVTALTDNQDIAPLYPANLRGELRPYQARGVGWLAFLERWGLGACLADDMGLGKTLQLIGFVLYLVQENRLEHPLLIVCPTSVLGNWEREVKRFAPSLKVMVHHGDKRLQSRAFGKAAAQQQLVITSYALVQRDLKTLQQATWQGVVLDEAQNIKNPDAKQSQAVRQLECPVHIALTGTPVENRLSELWSIMDFLNPGYLGPRNYFQRRFAIPIERYGDTTSLQALRLLTQPFILRRLKTDRSIIQDLPQKQEMAVFCGLSEAQAALYQQTVDAALGTIEDATGIQRKGLILALLTRLKQLCNHPCLIADGKASLEPDLGQFRNQSGKLQCLEEMLEVALAEGDRALIFTQFAEWGKLLQPYLERQLGRETLLLYGGVPKAKREAMIDRFQHDPQGPRLFILSLKAGGVGLNLTRANHVFHFDRWWNPAVENQATDRVFRIGQTRNVQVHKFVCSGTLEERIHDMIEGKKALAEQVIGTGEHWLTELDTNQLRDLLLLDRSTILGEE
jgi:SNF2 family DNA or RNA helicase